MRPQDAFQERIANATSLVVIMCSGGTGLGQATARVLGARMPEQNSLGECHSQIQHLRHARLKSMRWRREASCALVREIAGLT